MTRTLYNVGSNSGSLPDGASQPVFLCISVMEVFDRFVTLMERCIPIELPQFSLSRCSVL